MDKVVSRKTRHTDLIETAIELAKIFAERAAAHDDNDMFVETNYADLKASGVIAAGVPVELGGGGANVRTLCDVLRIIAQSCGSTGLALSMHTHQVAIPAWRWHHQEAARPMVEPLLRRVSDENIVLLERFEFKPVRIRKH